MDYKKTKNNKNRKTSAAPETSQLWIVTAEKRFSLPPLINVVNIGAYETFFKLHTDTYIQMCFNLCNI